MVVELGGWDHLWADGEGCRAKLKGREKGRELHCVNRLHCKVRNGPGKWFMVALEG